MEDGRLVIENEFAAVEICKDDTGNALRLRLVDLRTGRTATFDALFLESIIWLSPDQQDDLMDPAARWSSAENGNLPTEQAEWTGTGTKDLLAGLEPGRW